MPERLRAETRAAHEAVERAVDWERRTATRAGYRALLARLHGFHAVWEPTAAAALADDAFFAPRRKLPLLEADLRHLGMQAAEVAALPRCVPGPPMATRAEVLGALYVVEGSTLGGQLIARQVAARLGLHEAGLAYYRAYGPETGRMWQAFRARLLAESDAATDAAVLRGAHATFATLRAWLAE